MTRTKIIIHQRKMEKIRIVIRKAVLRPKLNVFVVANQVANQRIATLETIYLGMSGLTVPGRSTIPKQNEVNWRKVGRTTVARVDVLQGMEVDRTIIGCGR